MKEKNEKKIRHQQENVSKLPAHLHKCESMQKDIKMKLVYEHPDLSQSLDPSRKFRLDSDLIRTTNLKEVSRASALPGRSNIVNMLE